LGSFKRTKLSKVHTLVVSLIQEHLHHSTVTLHVAQTLKNGGQSPPCPVQQQWFLQNDTVKNHALC
jgi:hypothetical protein